ncbi:hypothetical protein ACED29_10905 [Shewanella sp. 5S214]|uniref:hypothetical protein n=1 Tax=Shewanella sp. 5S214 TaxID=3229999 RepID=UPI00352EA460
MKLVLYRNLFSIAQLSMVHVPFIIISSLASPIVASIVFVSRAVFQPVQIVVKTFEAIDQKKISEFEFNYKVVFDFVVKYILISSTLGFICLIISVSILYKFYDVNGFPTNYDLIIWGGIYTLLSINKVFEMFFIKYNNYSYIIAAYFSGFIFFVLFSSFFFGNGVSSSSQFSLTILVSWLLVSIVLILKLKRLNEVVNGNY